MRYNRYNRSKPTPRTIVVKYAGECACCGATIKAGETADYYPIGTIASRTTAAIAHRGGLDGNSARCTSEIRNKQTDPGFVDIDRAYEDSCAEICGR